MCDSQQQNTPAALIPLTKPDMSSILKLPEVLARTEEEEEEEMEGMNRSRSTVHFESLKQDPCSSL